MLRKLKTLQPGWNRIRGKRAAESTHRDVAARIRLVDQFYYTRNRVVFLKSVFLKLKRVLLLNIKALILEEHHEKSFRCVESIFDLLKHNR